MKSFFIKVSCLVLWGCMAIAPQNSQAQTKGEPITIGEKFELESQVLGESRPYLIGLPDGYENSDQSYPVLYLLDGSGHFHHTTGTVKFLARSGRIPPMIVVAIPNTNDRTRDLTPPILKADKSRFPSAGGADNMLSFISDELMPKIEKDYRTSPYKILIGHSFGGLFAIHAMVHRPELFDALLAISPSLWWDQQELVEQARTFFLKNPEYEAKLYMTIGNEGGEMLGGAWKLSATMEEKAPAGLEWEFRLMKEEDHGSVPHRSTYYGLENIFKDWKGVDNPLVLYEKGGLEAINAHYQRMRDKFNLKDLKAPESLINDLGYQLLAANRPAEAIEVFKQNVEEYPKSSNVYDSLGEGYKENGQKEEAIKFYRKSLALNPGNTNAIDMLASMGVTYEPENVKISAKVLQSYIGTYQVNPDMEVSITVEDGRLYGEPKGGGKAELFPMSENKFYLKVDNIQVVFNKNEEGVTDRITIYQQGQEMVAKRMK